MRSVWLEMKKRPETQPDKYTYHLAITVARSYFMFQSAINLVQEMESAGICFFNEFKMDSCFLNVHLRLLLTRTYNIYCMCVCVCMCTHPYTYTHMHTPTHMFCFLAQESNHSQKHRLYENSKMNSLWSNWNIENAAICMLHITQPKNKWQNQKLMTESHSRITITHSPTHPLTHSPNYCVILLFSSYLKLFSATRGVEISGAPHIVIFEIIKRYLGDRSRIIPE
jgi:hypothetical protein